MKKLRKNKKGFTLVELVVVIAILAILASTATVATIAILNNSRKTPVSDGASKIKDIFTNYCSMDYPDSVAGFETLLKETLPDLSGASNNRVMKKTASQVAKTDATAGDGICVALPNNTSLKCKSAAWELVVFNQYYKCVIKLNDGGTAGKVTIGSIEKF